MVKGCTRRYAADSVCQLVSISQIFSRLCGSVAFGNELIDLALFAAPLLEAMARVPSHIGTGVAYFVWLERKATRRVYADVAEEVKRQILPDILQAISQSRANDLDICFGQRRHRTSESSFAGSYAVSKHISCIHLGA